MLAEVLENTHSDLRMEIADTDSKDYRDMLKRRKAVIAKVLLELGYTNVAHLTVGFNGWKEAGGAVEETAPNPKYFKPA